MPFLLLVLDLVLGRCRQFSQSGITSEGEVEDEDDSPSGLLLARQHFHEALRLRLDYGAARLWLDRLEPAAP